jgi:DNA-binding response OmpR family regulator
MMTYLIIDDELAIRKLLVAGLTEANVRTIEAENGEDGLRLAARSAPDLILLDLGLPDMDGTDVCRQLRKISQVPIIVVSARDEEIDRVIALEIGADDYVVKPFGMRELIARIKAVARRSANSEPSTAAMTEREFGPLRIDTRSIRVSMSGEEVHLTPKEFELLVYLSDDPGAVHRRTDILHDVWDTNWYGTTKTLDAHVAAIRKKLGNSAWIESVRGVGFRFGIPT